MIARLALLLMPLAVSCKAAPDPNAKWSCPMHPTYVSDRAGDCAICGMRLVRVHAVPSGNLDGSSNVALSPDKQRLIGVKTVGVIRGTMAGEIRTSGRITVDETRVHRVTARFEGYAEALAANFTGQKVDKGAPLVSIYSPELLATQEEYLLALKSRDALTASGLPDVAESARARLRLFGITNAQLERLGRQGKPERAMVLTAPISGYIMQKNVTAGSKVGPSDPLFELADLSRLWVLADLYERELPRLKLGASATVTLSYWPGLSWRGRIDYISPTVDDKTRTVKVRISVENTNQTLRPEMFADVRIATEPKSALLIPEDAVIDGGNHHTVFVARSGGELEPRTIEVGLRASGQYEVLSGLALGESVATGASFLLDSESRLKGARP